MIVSPNLGALGFYPSYALLLVRLSSLASKTQNCKLGKFYLAL